MNTETNLERVCVLIFVKEPNETLCTGVFDGFKDEDDAQQWIELYMKEWNIRSNVNFFISHISDKSTML